ncbi:MAG TPA: isoamylase early set domain-containing protein [Verrucomicrobiae bacterium]
MKTATFELGSGEGMLLRAGRRTLHHVDFYCYAPGAEQVALVGDFNGWEPAANPMQRTPDGYWTTSLELAHGHHQYQFIVDGLCILLKSPALRSKNQIGIAQANHSLEGEIRSWKGS